jgi:hypothetical protein
MSITGQVHPNEGQHHDKEFNAGNGPRSNKIMESRFQKQGGIIGGDNEVMQRRLHERSRLARLELVMRQHVLLVYLSSLKNVFVKDYGTYYCHIAVAIVLRW